MKLLVRIITISLFSLQMLFVYSPSVGAAPSKDVLIYQVQTGSIVKPRVTTSASQEIILIYNSLISSVNVTNWCLYYSSASNSTVRKLACVTPPSNQVELWLASGGLVSFATSEFIAANPEFVADGTFTAGLSPTGGHVWIEDATKNPIDLLGWGTAAAPEKFPALVHTLGLTLSRNTTTIAIDSDNNLVDFSSLPLINPIVNGLDEETVATDECKNIIGVQIRLPDGYSADLNGDCIRDMCLNIIGLQEFVPQNYESLVLYDCSLIPLENSVLFITEMLPNAPSTDTGNEFIEIFNPNSKIVDLVGYSLEVGPSFTKKFVFSEGKINPNQYMTLSDAVTNIILPNSSGVRLRLISPAGNVVSESSLYNNASDDTSWALVEDLWIYTNQITPGNANKPFLEKLEDEVLGVTSVVASCPAGKFRNPETNRCRTLETALSALTPCNQNEYRNPDTNRCNNISSATSILSPCKAGQVRNPETNRCRNIAVTSSLAPCPAGQERNPDTNRCRKVSVLGVSDTSGIPTITDVAVENTSGNINYPVIFIALLLTSGYMIFEWRREISRFYSRTRQKLVH